MGRGSRTTDTQHAAFLRGADARIDQTELARLRSAATTACDAIFAAHPDPEAHLARIDEAASATVAGRGGRLMIALNDLIEAERLAYSEDPAEQALARASFENAIWHASRLAAVHDTDGTLRDGLAAVVRTGISATAPAVLDDLHRARPAHRHPAR